MGTLGNGTVFWGCLFGRGGSYVTTCKGTRWSGRRSQGLPSGCSGSLLSLSATGSSSSGARSGSPNHSSMAPRVACTNARAELCAIGSIDGHIRTDNEPGEQNQEAEGSLALEPRMTMGTTGSFVHEAELNAPS